MSQLIELLRRSCGSGEILTLAYAGGGSPGSARDVVALSCSPSLLEARDVVAGTTKHYHIDKILWVETGGDRVDAVGAPGLSLPALQGLAEYADHLRAEFEALGWYVHESETSLGVGCCFKNGKPKKTPSVAITFFERDTDTVFDPDLEDFIETPRALTGAERPWRVDSWRYKAGRTFGSLQKAMWEFYNEVRESDPQSSNGMFAGH